MAFETDKMRKSKSKTITTFVGGGIQFINGDCNNINLINLLQPNWICTNIGINNIQDELNMQRYVNGKKKRFFCLVS